MKALKQTTANQEIAQHGNLRTTAFVDLLVALLDLQKTGTLRLADEECAVHAVLRFERGVPTGARVNIGETSLLQTLIPLCARSVGDYRFIDQVDEVGHQPGAVLGRVDPVTLIAAAMRGPAREDVVEKTLAPIGSELLRLHPRANLKRYAFTVQEREVVLFLEQAPMSLSELVTQVSTSEHVVRRVVYVLKVTRGISLMPAGRQLVSGTIQRVVPTAECHAPPAGRATSSTSSSQLAARSLAPKRPTGLPPSSAGRYHVHDAEPESVQIALRGLPDARNQNAEPGNANGDASLESQLERACDGLTHYREAERLLRRSDYPAALQRAEAALSAEGSARHEALYGWLLHLNAGAGAGGRVHPRALQHLDSALNRDPTCEAAHYYKALLLKQLGQLDEARSHLKRVCKRNPDHQEATRELRLLEMRGRTRDSSNLVHRIFGRTPGVTKPDQS